MAAKQLCIIRLLIAAVIFIVPSAAVGKQRVALVIGNSTYAVSPLQNPSNDADAIAKALGQIGFETVVKKDLDAAGMKAALKEFARAAAGSEIALVFYAGHGMEMGGKNYLIPVDAKLERASDIELEATSLDVVLGQLDGVRGLKLVILDACRNSTFRVAGGTRAVARGLGRIEPEDNTLVAYAARAGTTAEDGTGEKHSPFTAALLKHIATPGLEIRLLLGRVRDEVVVATSGIQTPHVYGTLGGQAIYLTEPPHGSGAATSPAPQPHSPTQQAAIPSNQEVARPPSSVAQPQFTVPNEPLSDTIPVSAEILTLVEGHPFFANAPSVSIRSYDVSSIDSFTVNGTPTKSPSEDTTTVRWLRQGIIESNVSQEGATIHATCRPGSCTHTNQSISVNAANGLISLGYKSTGTSKMRGIKPTNWASYTRLLRLENLKGAVFPIRAGNRFSYDQIFEEISSTGDEQITYLHSCEITKKYEANSFHASLAGQAYLCVCKVQTRHKKNPAYDRGSQSKELFFERLGVWISADSVSPREVLVQDDTLIKDFTNWKSFKTLKAVALAQQN